MVKEKVIDSERKQLKANGTKATSNNKKQQCDKTVSLINSKKHDDIDYDLVPPDGGWGWLVLLGSMMVNILIPGTIKSFGVLFIEFMEAFKATQSSAAWIPALCYFLYSSLGPVSSILSVKYSYRTVTILGGASAALGMILSYWASSVGYLYISYGVLVGIGAGLSFPPTVYIVTSYFVKLRGLANGLCISGSALGSIILPPVLRYLLETYGYRGAVLIMGGITLNVFVAALFYEPVEQHLIRVPKNQNMLEDIAEEEEEDGAEDFGIVLKFETVDELQNADVKSTITHNDSISSGLAAHKQLIPYTPTAQSPEHLQSYLGDINDDKQFIRSASAAVVQNYSKNPEDYAHGRTRKISTPVRLPQRNQTFTQGQGPCQLNSQSSLYAVAEGGRSSNKLDRFQHLRNNSKNRLSKRSPSTSSFQYVSTPFHGSMLSFQPKEFSSHISLRSLASGANQANTTSTVGAGGTGGAGGHDSHLDDSVLHDSIADGLHETTTGKRTKFFDLSLLTDPTYLVILISNSTNAIGYTNFIILLPSFGLALGFDKSYSAYLISIVSATDLIGRIGGSALSDLGFIPKTWYFIGGLAISGVSLAVLPFATTYGMVSFWCALFGLASGVYVGITAVIMADMLGTERLTSSYGISLFVNGILQLIGPPLCGLWFEAVQNYNPLFHTLGITLLAGASLWSFMPFIKRQPHKKAKDEMIDDACDDD